MTDAPERIIMDFGYAMEGDIATHKEWNTPTEYVRADIAPSPEVVRGLVEAVQFARNRLEMIANESWNGDARDFKRSLAGVFADFDAALAAYEKERKG